MRYYVFKTRRSIANCADGNSWLFNLLYRSCAIICSCLSQVPHHVPLTEFVSPLIPAAAEECCLSPPGWSALTVRASQWLLRDNQGFSFFLVRPQHNRSPLPAKCKYMTQHCDISNELCISLCVSLVCLSCSCLFYSVCFSNMFFFLCFFHTIQLHSHLKDGDFNKIIKKGNRFFLVSHVCLWWSDLVFFSIFPDEIDINGKNDGRNSLFPDKFLVTWGRCSNL